MTEKLYKLCLDVRDIKNTDIEMLIGKMNVIIEKIKKDPNYKYNVLGLQISSFYTQEENE